MQATLKTVPTTIRRYGLGLPRTSLPNRARQAVRSRSVSREWVLILPFVFFAVHGAFSFQLGGNSVGVFLPPGAAARNPGIIGYVIIPGVAYSVVLWMILSNWKHVASLASHFKLLTLLALLTICSAAWSQNPMRSAVFGTSYIIGTLFAYSLVSRFEPYQLMALLNRAGMMVCGLSLIMAVCFPQYGVVGDLDPRNVGAWRGIFIDRTSGAKEMVFLLTPAIAGWRGASRGGRAISILLFSVMLVRAQAVTALIALFAYIVFLAMLRLKRALGPRPSSILLLLTIVALLSVAIVGANWLPAILQDLGRDPTLTGRTDIWRAVLNSVFKRPLLGYGFYSFWEGLHGESGNIFRAVNWTPGYAHNGILEIWLQLGIIGVLIFVATLIQALRNAWFCFRNGRTRRYDWFLGLIALALVYNIDEATVVFPNDLLPILYVVTCCGLAKAVWEIKQDRYREVLQCG
jgi:O-antigen ligase